MIAPPAQDIDRLNGDALRLEQVLINLAGNAIKFTEQGHVEVAISVLEASASEVSLRFVVRDTGIGIPVAQQQEIFNQFSQADASTTRHFGGTGLGLTISRRLVEQMGGEIGVSSVPGEGSEFWFLLTLARDTTLAPTPVLDLDLLIVDDDAITAEALRDTALALGWRVATADSGADALARLRAGHSNGAAANGAREALLVNQQLLDMDGLALVQAVRAADGDDARPIWVMTAARARQRLLAHSASHLADRVLDKPVTAPRLYQAITKTRQLVPQGLRDGDARLEGVRLLVADDSDINQEVADRVFSDEGAIVLLADDGLQALQLLAEHGQAIDIVLLDIQMPNLDGYETARRIRAQPEYDALPIIALTAGASTEEKAAAQAAGMNDFIAKPFDIEQAITALQRHASPQPAAPRTTSARALAPEAAAPPPSTPAVLDITSALTIWKEPQALRAQLRRFAQSYGNSLQDSGKATPADLTARVHKMSGVAGHLGLMELARGASQAERRLRSGEDGKTAVSTLAATLDRALEAITAYAGEDAEPAAPTSPPPVPQRSDRDTLRKLLQGTLEAFDSRNPATVEPLLGALAGHLPGTALKPLWSAVENFDFAHGQSATRALARAHNISLG